MEETKGIDLQVAVLVSSSGSVVAGLVLCVLCGVAASSTAADVDSHPAVHLIARVLAHLGLADALYALSFVLAAWRQPTASGGAVCQVASFLSGFAGTVSTWWTIVVAWVLRGALTRPRDSCHSLLGRQYFHRVALATWGLPLAIETALYSAVALPALPQHRVGPEEGEPWCWWRGGSMVLSTIYYLWVLLCLGYIGVTYGAITSHFCHARALLAQHTRSLLVQPLDPNADDPNADDAHANNPHSNDLYSDSHASHSSAAPLHTAPLHTAPLHTAPLHTAPLHTAPLHTAPLRTAPLGRGTLERAPRLSWVLDVRLLSYLAAYVVSNGPSVIHRLLQVHALAWAWAWLGWVGLGWAGLGWA
jgi:hypothetical protein